MFCFLLNAALIVVQEFAETLEMYNFTRPQEFDHLVDVRVVRKAKYIVISRASLLLRRHVLDDIGDRIGLHREISRAEWYSRRIDRVNSVCMPCVVIAVPILIEALCPFSVGQLSYYAADYLKMPQLVSTYMVSVELLSSSILGLLKKWLKMISSGYFSRQSVKILGSFIVYLLV